MLIKLKEGKAIPLEKIQYIERNCGLPKIHFTNGNTLILYETDYEKFLAKYEKTLFYARLTGVFRNPRIRVSFMPEV